MILRIGPVVYGRLLAQAESERPNECCGVLMGRRGPGVLLVERATAATNVSEDGGRRGYRIDWVTLLAAVRAGRRGDRVLVGFYHSHPGGGGSPSARDRVAAWAEHAYVIIPVVRGRASGLTGWWMPGSAQEFEPMSVDCEDGAGTVRGGTGGRLPCGVGKAV